MREKERLVIVEQIKKDIDNLDSIPKKEHEINELLKNEFVKKYLSLKQEVESIKNGFFCTSNDKIIKLRFIRAMLGTDAYEGVRECRHDLWLYLRSEKYLYDLRSEHDCCISCDDENDSDFAHNTYMCFDCHRMRKEKNWKQFEMDNLVLKDYDKKEAFYYLDRYFELLYKMNPDDAVDAITQEFNSSESKKLVK